MSKFLKVASVNELSTGDGKLVDASADPQPNYGVCKERTN